MTIEDIEIYLASEHVLFGDAMLFHATDIQREMESKPFEQALQKQQSRSTIGSERLLIDLSDIKFSWSIDAIIADEPEDMFPTAVPRELYQDADVDIPSQYNPDLRITDGSTNVPEGNIEFRDFSFQVKAPDERITVPLGFIDVFDQDFTVEDNNGNLLTEGTDYEFNYNKGRINLTNVPYGETYTFTGVMNFSKRNMGRLGQRLSVMGGPMQLGFDKSNANGEYASYSGLVTRLNWTLQGSQPGNSNIQFEFLEGIEEG